MLAFPIVKKTSLNRQEQSFLRFLTAYAFIAILKLNKLNDKIMKKGFYYNFKHDPSIDVTNYAYLILSYPAGYSEDADIPMVSYLRLYKTPHIWQRPLEMVTDDVSARPDNPTGQKVRFEEITDPEILKVLIPKFKEMYPDINPE